MSTASSSGESAAASAAGGSFGKAAVARAPTSDAGTPLQSPRHVVDDGSPVVVEERPGELPRMVFRSAPNHMHDEIWQNRPVRKAPTVPGQDRIAARLAYFNNSKSLGNSNVLQVILRDHGYERVEQMSDDWAIFWCAGQVDAATLQTFGPHQRVNKFPRASALTLKSNLWSCFARMLQKHGPEPFNFMPQTFILPGQMTLYAEFMERRLAEGQGSDVWILKPAAAYCGRGIFLHRPGDVPQGDSVITPPILEHRGVACRYIDPPFLIDGLKSDIRLYVLCTSVHPLTVYLFEEGLGRFATEKYTMADLDQRCMHLTNYSLNKHSQNFVKNTSEDVDDSGSKWSLSAFKRRLEKELGSAAKAAEVWKQVDDLVVKTLIAAEPTIFEAMKQHVPAQARGEPNQMCFQVFGFDVMLDRDCKPWLLECNLDPALRTESPLDLKIKSTMLVDLLNVVGMPVPPPVEPSASQGTEEAATDVSDAAESAVDVSEGGGEAAAAEMTADQAAAAWKARRAAEMAKRADGAATDEASPSGLSDLEQWQLHLTNAEFRRSQATKWRRLLPCSQSAFYNQFLDPSRTLNALPFDK